jgi:hypothetical protein
MPWGPRSGDSVDYDHGGMGFLDRFKFGPGEEMFNFTVCTATWLRDNPPPEGFQFMRGTILLSRWDYAILNRALADLCTRTEADDWPGGGAPAVAPWTMGVPGLHAAGSQRPEASRVVVAGPKAKGQRARSELMIRAHPSLTSDRSAGDHVQVTL